MGSIGRVLGFVVFWDGVGPCPRQEEGVWALPAPPRGCRTGSQGAQRGVRSPSPRCPVLSTAARLRSLSGAHVFKSFPALTATTGSLLRFLDKTHPISQQVLACEPGLAVAVRGHAQSLRGERAVLLQAPCLSGFGVVAEPYLGVSAPLGGDASCAHCWELPGSSGWHG